MLSQPQVTFVCLWVVRGIRINDLTLKCNCHVNNTSHFKELSLVFTFCVLSVSSVLNSTHFLSRPFMLNVKPFGRTPLFQHSTLAFPPALPLFFLQLIFHFQGN